MAGVKRQHAGGDYSEPKKYKPDNKRLASLNIDLRRLEDAFCPKFRKPEELTAFSVVLNNDEDGKKLNVCSQVGKYSTSGKCARAICDDPFANRMNIIVPDPLNSLALDLNVGYGKQIEKDRDNEFLNLLLEILDKANLVGRSQFVCWRGLLTKLAASPYEVAGRFDDGMKVVCQKLGDVVYLRECPTEQFEKKQQNIDERQKLMQYWGMKFESYITAKPGEKPNTKVPLDFNAEYGAVVSTKLGSTSLIFGGEIDCAWPSDNKRYVELKTTREFGHAGHERSFRRFKLMKWWLQSFLIGIEDVLCGFRDDNGVVKSCKWFKVADMPKMIKQDRDTWKPSACLAFLEKFLGFVQNSVLDDLVPHVFVRLPNEKTFHMTVDEEGVHKFLPNWFVSKYGTG